MAAPSSSSEIDDDANAWSADESNEQLEAESYRTPKLDSGGFEFEAANQATPTLRDYGLSRTRSRSGEDGLPTLTLSNLHLRDGAENGDDQEQEVPDTARPVMSSRKSSVATVSAKSPDLYELASMYQPDEPTSMVVADASGGYFESVNLATPMVEHFSSMDGGMDWTGSRTPLREKGTKKGTAGRQRAKSRDSAWGHSKTTSDASIASNSSAGSEAVKQIRRSSWYAPSASSFANTVTQEPESFNPEEHVEGYNPRASTSTSSIADSIGTAGDATDSEYEDQRTKSHSRQVSRRPSATEVPTLAGKRLSSFAPITGLNISQTNLAMGISQNGSTDNVAAGTSAGSTPQGSPPLRSETNGGLRPDYRPSAISQGMSANPSIESNASTNSSASSSGDPSTSNGHTAGPAPVTSIEHKRENGTSPKKTKKHKQTPLEKAISKTRPRDLPPKNKEEDRKHLKEYAEMLAASKLAEKKRQAVLAAKIHQKELLAAQALSSWEKNILPNWKSVLRDEKLREVWWSGTMPPRHRARLWQGCIGNGLALSKASYSRAVTLVQSLYASGRFPEEIVQSIERDIEQTLPQTKLFQVDRPLYKDLRDLLMAHAVFWKETPLYAEGTSYLGAMLLCSMPVQEAFLCLVNLVNKSLLKTFYAGTQDDIEAYYRVFNTLLADKMPKVYRNFVSHGIRPALYLRPWLTTLYTRYLGSDASTRLWDIFVLEGDQFLYRLALALLQILEARLFNPDHEELAQLFRGEDRGARAIVAREHVKPDDQVEPWEIYECLGATEENIFEVVKAMEWKEATFHRLLTRELPDADA